MEFGIIYKVINKINGICYIGQTRSSITHRKSQHKFKSKNGSKGLLHTAIREYGWENFEWKIIDSCSSENMLNEYEVKYINQFNTLKPNGYNMTLNKYGFLGTDLSGKNNPRYGDHRTYEEIHGKEKAERIKQKLKNTFTEERKKEIGILTTQRLLTNNPMNNEKSRKKLSETRKGGNNPAALYKWEFILPNGKTYHTDCLREFCRETGFKRHILMKIIEHKNYKPRDVFYQGWKCIKTFKEC
jgi:group I intron endonuclease